MIKIFRYLQFNFVLKFFYTNEFEKSDYINFTVLDFAAIYEIADEYLVDSLKLWIESLMIEYINNLNIEKNIDKMLCIEGFGKHYNSKNIIDFCDWYKRKYYQYFENIDVSIDYYGDSLSDYTICSS